MLKSYRFIIFGLLGFLLLSVIFDLFAHLIVLILILIDSSQVLTRVFAIFLLFISLIILYSSYRKDSSLSFADIVTWLFFDSHPILGRVAAMLMLVIYTALSGILIFGMSQELLLLI